jgi:hypothetical protein
MAPYPTPAERGMSLFRHTVTPSHRHTVTPSHRHTVTPTASRLALATLLSIAGSLLRVAPVRHQRQPAD